MTSAPLPLKKLLQYGFIALPVAFAGFPLYVLAPDFYATHYGLSLTYLGSLLLAIRLFDGIQDPLLGWLADRLHRNFLLLITAAGALLCLAIFALFNMLAFSPPVWFALCMLLAVSSYSLLTIVLGAQATLWTKDRNDQTRIASVRESFGLVGLVIAVSMPALLKSFLEPNQAYLGYSLILFFLMAAGLEVFARGKLFSNPDQTEVTSSTDKTAIPSRGDKTDFPSGTNKIEFPSKKGNIEAPPAPLPSSPIAAIRALPSTSLRLFAVYGLSMLASSIPAVLVIFYVRDLLGAEHLMGLFLMLYFLSGALSMPMWKKLSQGLGKYRTWGLANILAVLGFIGAFFLNAGDLVPYAGVCLVSGFALGADLTLPPSILADQIHENHNSAFSGTHYAFLAFFTKLSLALASVLTLPALDAAGFHPEAANTEAALWALSFSYALVPCLLKLAATGLLYLFFVRTPTRKTYGKNLSNSRSSHYAEQL